MVAVVKSMRAMTDAEVRAATRRACGLWVAASVPMLRLERRMMATGGPGIIAFELAGGERRATEILELWGTIGAAAARTSLWLDFGYMCTYGAFSALLAEGADRRVGQRSGVRLARVAQLACVTAVVADACEGVALLGVLQGRDRQVCASRARAAALTKFAMLSVPLAWWATSHITGRYSTVRHSAARRLSSERILEG